MSLFLDVLLCVVDIIGLIIATVHGKPNAMMWLVLLAVHCLFVKMDE